MPSVREFNEATGDLSVRGFLHVPDNPSGDALVLTHGAGANCRSPLLTAVATEFCTRGWAVLRFDLPFRQLRSFGPPMRGSAARDQRGIELAVGSIRKQFGGRVFAGGHSYGGRQCTMIAAEKPELLDGLLLLSYPLHPPQKPEDLRTAHFAKLQTAGLFVHGSRDGFGSQEEMSEALRLIPARSKLVPVVGAGHELMTKKNQEELPKLVVKEFQDFYDALSDLL
jgi:predicted alpha/beta-hydrolase family hydrolase